MPARSCAAPRPASSRGKTSCSTAALSPARSDDFGHDLVRKPEVHFSGSCPMKAVWYERTGAAPDVLTYGDMPTPVAAPGEVRVKLEASGVNPADVGRRAGSYRAMEFPRVIPNSDGAGIIDQVGDGVTRLGVGQRVWLYNGQRNGRAFGTAAEYITLAAHLVTPLPNRLSFAEGATPGIPAMTAGCCLNCDGPILGKAILVTGGAGAVGHYAIQLAKWGGARVIATVSSPAKDMEARRAGADLVINYRT